MPSAILAPARPPAFARRTSRRSDLLPLWYSGRGQGRSLANSRCARRQRHRSFDERAIALGVSRTARHTGTGKGADVRIRCREAIRERLQEGNDLIFLRRRQAEVSDRHVEIVRDLGHRPAIYLFYRSRRAVSGSDRLRKYVARIVEMNQLLQALGVAVVKEFLLEIGSRRLGGGTQGRRQADIAAGRG